MEFGNLDPRVHPTPRARFGAFALFPFLTTLASEILPVAHAACLRQILFSATMGTFDRGIVFFIGSLSAPAMATSRAHENPPRFAVFDCHFFVFFRISTLGASLNIVKYITASRAEDIWLTRLHGYMIFQIKQA